MKRQLIIKLYLILFFLLILFSRTSPFKFRLKKPFKKKENLVFKLFGKTSRVLVINGQLPSVKLFLIFLSLTNRLTLPELVITGRDCKTFG